MKRIMKLLSLALALTLLFTACNGDTDSESTSEVESQSVGSEASVEETEESSDDMDSETEETGDQTGSATAQGFNGDLTVNVTLTDNKITAVTTDHQETENLGASAIDRLTEQVLEQQAINLDTVTGATYSSDAFLEALKNAMIDAAANPEAYVVEEESIEKENEEKETQVVVIGGGGAGFAAAITAKEAGAEVILLEKLPTVGGNTQISGGEYAAPANEIQQAEGIEDSPELFAQDMEVAGGDPALIRVLSENATPSAEWLRDDIGVEFLDSLMFFGGHSVKRSLIPVGHSGLEIIQKYQAKADELGIEVLTEHDVKELLSEDGKIVGVRVETPTSNLTVKADAVVIASGGFGANKELLYENDQEIDEHVLSTNSVGSTGDGILMAQKVGAVTMDIDQIQLYPICDVDTGKLLYVGDTRLVGGALLVNKEGHRFVEELGTRREISLAIKGQTDHVGYLLWDEKSSEETGTIHSHATEAESLYERGHLVKADTIEELADHFGIDVDQLMETVETFNTNSKNDKDPDFNLRMLGWTVEEGPFYMLKAVPAVHHTMGGIQINTEAEVLDADGNPIEGLYAAGEVTGGIHGSNRLGSAAIADITVFGRIAGENAAKHVLDK